jgi:hypothetical protein
MLAVVVNRLGDFMDVRNRFGDFTDAVSGPSCLVRVNTRVNVKNLDRSRQSFGGSAAGIRLFLRSFVIGGYLSRLFYKLG